MKTPHGEQTHAEAMACPEGTFSGFLPQGRGCDGGADSSVKCFAWMISLWS